MKKIKVIQFGAGEVGFRNAVYMNEMDNIEVLVCEKFFSSELKLLNERKIPIFASDKKAYDELKKNGTKLKGIVTDLAGRIDVADDATRDAKANFQLYKELGCRHIIGNGMEKHGDFDVSFSSLGNFNEARGKYKIRVVSCNTNGLIRVLDAISKEFGLRDYEVFLIRRSTDPGRKGAVINDLEYSSEPSHHAEDVLTVRPDFKGTSTAAVSSVNRYHLHDILIYVKKTPKNAEQVYNVLEAQPRVATTKLIPDKDSTSKLTAYFSRKGRFIGDSPENLVIYGSVQLNRRRHSIRLKQWIDNASIVCPENINAIYAAMGVHKDALKSVKFVDKRLSRELLPGYK